MICGKCNSSKETVLVSQNYQLPNAICTIHHIPATKCNCQLYISNSINQEIVDYLEENKAANSTLNVSFAQV
ncbi:hypothetical protein KZO01_25580 [Kurthia zopfii]|uniref:Uncharacterized protein n=1 Tax=Kurthia zopfii TaxID=1650 RepID=A0A2U3A9B7_9BACL|nr:hypothetical protein [Kurthia zopfii]PWI21128.1 hypothetical protein DF281_13780 [Kurthia zopfii]TDR32694.1 hypothetical protein DFR61_1612 [Kurthia zopfii]STX09433.1 Uncharacterised protein [Kurthia zopfii]VEI06455.1 Uncharacterised protein [Kurthia zopfii]GEK32249.1 hypothetical protein KZO01_25580 [Kurthia zopfii]